MICFHMPMTAGGVAKRFITVSTLMWSVTGAIVNRRQISRLIQQAFDRDPATRAEVKGRRELTVYSDAFGNYSSVRIPSRRYGRLTS